MLDEGTSLQSLAVKYGVNKSTISRIRPNKDTIMEITNKNQQTLKRVRSKKYLDIDRYLLGLFKNSRFNDLIV